MTKMRLSLFGTMLMTFLLFAGTALAGELVLYRGAPVAAGQALVTPAPGMARAGLVGELRERGFTPRFASTFDGRRVAVEVRHQSMTAERFLLVEFDPAVPLDWALAELSAVSGVADVYPNQVYFPLFVPDDPYYSSYQQNLQQIYLEDAWERSRGKRVTVAVIDTGYELTGLTDGAKNMVEGYDFADGDDDPTDTNGHGTHVANIIMHHTNNGVGAAGVAPEAILMPLKVFADGSGGAYEGDIVSAIDWATAEGAHVINMSLGGGHYSSLPDSAVRDAAEAGVVVVAASGNDDAGSVSYPAKYEDVIAVGSCQKHGLEGTPVRSDFSNTGEGLDLVAPGEGILAEADFGHGIGYYQASGTSMASPHVAGVAALLIAAVLQSDDSYYTATDICEAMTSTAQRPSWSEEEWDPEIGYGEVQADAALDAMIGPAPNEPPSAFIWADPTSGSAPLTVQFAAGASDPDGNIISYLWSIDGRTLTTGTFSHTFEKSGDYTVYLSVADDGGESGVARTTIHVSPGSDDQKDEDDSRLDCGIAGARGALDLPFIALLLGGWLLVRRTAMRRKDG